MLSIITKKKPRIHDRELKNITTNVFSAGTFNWQTLKLSLAGVELTQVGNLVKHLHWIWRLEKLWMSNSTSDLDNFNWKLKKNIDCDYQLVQSSIFVIYFVTIRYRYQVYFVKGVIFLFCFLFFSLISLQL